MIRGAILGASRSQVWRRRVAHSRLAKRASARFLPGEELEDAIQAAADLWSHRIPALLTHLGEDVGSEAEAGAARSHYLRALEALESAGIPGDISVKLTQLGLELDRLLCFENLDDIAARAGALGRLVWVDMEGSPTTTRTLDLFQDLAAAHSNLGIALQANLLRTEADLERLVPLRPRIRLVKGAYSEPPGLAHQGHRAVDAAYLELAGQLLSWSAAGRVEPVFATHDVELIEQIERLAGTLGAGGHGYEVHMLYGIRAAEQRRLAESGTRVRVLVSYGPDWAAWYLRRLAERPANIVLAVSTVLDRAEPAGSRGER